MDSIEALIKSLLPSTTAGVAPRGFDARLQAARGFPNGFWHAEDADGAFEVMSGCLTDLELDPALLPVSIVRAVVDRHAEEEHEDIARRREITACIEHVNQALEARGSARRFFRFEEDIAAWESEEPVWIFLSNEERHWLIERGLVRPFSRPPE